MTGTRAVLIKHAPDAYPRCDACGGSLFGNGNKGKAPAICCNVHESGRWVGRFLFHPTGCYQGQYGSPTKAPKRVANLRRGSMQ